jgi:hypothetical protein
MRYLQKKRRRSPGFDSQTFADNDPLTGVANLFDVGLVFIVGLIVTLFSAYHLADLFDEKSELTIMKQNQNGAMELITKQGKKIKAVKVSREKIQGQRLGIAYQLQDGTMVYVPEQ